MSLLSPWSVSYHIRSPVSHDSTLSALLTVQRSERGGIVKAPSERVLLWRKLAEHIQPQLTWPPVTASSTSASCIAEGRTLPERACKSGERRLVPSCGQEVSLVDACIRTTLGGGERQEPDQHRPDEGCHGRRSEAGSPSVSVKQMTQRAAIGADDDEKSERSV